jgi:acetylornithine deacetylase/succinyl-diaminopimelate desuccinylase-like protein
MRSSVPAPEELSSRVRAAIDTDRLLDLVRQACRIPSVLGEEGELAAFLHDVMKQSGFESAALQPVLPDRPNAVAEMSFGAGRRVAFTGHLDTKPVSRGWTATTPHSGELIDGSVYGHGIVDMKAALVCQIVAMEAGCTAVCHRAVRR